MELVRYFIQALQNKNKQIMISKQFQINFIRTHYKLAANLASESNSYRNWTKYQLHIVDSEQNLFSFESPSQSNRRIKPPTLFEEDLAHIYDFSNILQSYKDLLQSPRTVVAHCTQC